MMGVTLRKRKVVPVMGMFGRKAAEEPLAEPVPRAIWEGYEEIEEPGSPSGWGLGWLALRGAAWVAFLSALVLACYLLTGVYYTFRFYPSTYVNGTDVSGMTVAEASEALSAGALKDVSVTLRSGTYAIPADGAGARVSFDPSVGSLASGQSGWPWSRHEHACDVSVEYDKTAVLAAVNELLDAHPESEQMKPAGISFDDRGLMEYRPGVSAYSRDDAAARDIIAAQVMAGATEIDVTALECYDEPYALLPDPALENAAEQWNLRFEPPLEFRCGSRSVSIVRTDMASHASRSGSSLSVDGEWLRDTVASWFEPGNDTGGEIGASVSVRGVPVSDAGMAVLRDSRVRLTAYAVMEAFSSGMSGTELDASGMQEWLDRGPVLALDPVAGWAVVYVGGEALMSCAASFHNGMDDVRDVVAAVREEEKLRLSDGMTVGGVGCNVELADPEAMFAVFAESAPRCVAYLAQDGRPVASQELPLAPSSYGLSFPG